MRTTLNLRDEALAICRGIADRHGASMRDVVSEAIVGYYREHPRNDRARDFDLPASGEGGLHPGVDLDDRAALEDVMDGRG